MCIYIYTYPCAYIYIHISYTCTYICIHVCVYIYIKHIHLISYICAYPLVTFCPSDVKRRQRQVSGPWSSSCRFKVVSVGVFFRFRLQAQDLGSRVLGFRVLGVRGLGFRVLDLEVFGMPLAGKSHRRPGLQAFCFEWRFRTLDFELPFF